jgi:hypothetical protein
MAMHPRRESGHRKSDAGEEYGPADGMAFPSWYGFC